VNRLPPLLMLLLACHPAAAQTPSGGGVEIAVVEHRVDVGSGVERSKGPVFGAAVHWQVASRWTVGVRTAGGTLRGSAGVMDRKIAEVGLQASYDAASWLVLHSTWRRRVYVTDLARQAWTTLALGGEGRLSLLEGSAVGIVSATVQPSVSVRGLPAPDAAVTAGAGIEYRRGAARLILRYDLERYDFPERNGAPHLEQLSAFTVRFELRRRSSSSGS